MNGLNPEECRDASRACVRACRHGLQRLSLAGRSASHITRGQVARQKVPKMTTTTTTMRRRRRLRPQQRRQSASQSVTLLRRTLKCCASVSSSTDDTPQHPSVDDRACTAKPSGGTCRTPPSATVKSENGSANDTSSRTTRVCCVLCVLLVCWKVIMGDTQTHTPEHKRKAKQADRQTRCGCR